MRIKTNLQWQQFLSLASALITAKTTAQITVLVKAQVNTG